MWREMIQAARAPGHHRQRHEVLLLDAERLAAYLPREARPQQQRDHQDHVAEARLRDGDQHDRDEDGRQRQPDVGQPHEHGVGEAAAIAGDQAQQRAQRPRHPDGDERDDQRDLAAVDDPAQHVAAEAIGPQWMRPSRRAPSRPAGSTSG